MNENFFMFPFGSVNKDRVYGSDAFAQFFANIFQNGVFATVGNALQVKALDVPGMKVVLDTGAAHINGYQFGNAALYEMPINVASTTQDRVDSIVIRLDLPNRNISPVYKPGVITVERTATIWELQLATITVKKNSATVTQAVITDKRGDSSVGGYASPFEVVPVDGLVAQYGELLANFLTGSKSTFETWFNNLVDQLSDNQATNLQAQIDTLNTAISTANALLATKADDSKVVHNTGAETIGGAKTFTGDMSVNNLAVTGTLTQPIYTANVVYGGNTYKFRRTGNVVHVTMRVMSDIAGNVSTNAIVPLGFYDDVTDEPFIGVYRNNSGNAGTNIGWIVNQRFTFGQTVGGGGFVNFTATYVVNSAFPIN